MIARHEAIVASRFDALRERFKREVAHDDFRLRAIIDHIGPLDGRRVLDLGSGKGRFCRALAERGARVVALDISQGMLAEGTGVDRVRASARRLPFRSASFDAMIAVEVLEHLPRRAIDLVLGEVRRVLRAGGSLVVLDKSVASWNARRPWLPSVAMRWIDERRGLWMYFPGDGVRERWFWPGSMKRRLRRWFTEVRVAHPLSQTEAGRFPFQFIPGTRLFVLWAARVPGGTA
jgi:2-polyprenyl-6-hydroxyphenyl methylase/3-demethylubiquinone-9 3-methyltransferase